MAKEKKTTLEHPEVNVLEKIAIFILAIPLIFIYVPLRYLARKLSSLILWAIAKFDKSETKNKEPEENKIIKFFTYVSSFHPYDGGNKYVKYFDNNITGEKVKAQHIRAFIFFLLPSFSAFLIFVVIPFFMGIYFSFTDWNGLTETIGWLGFGNYSEIFTDYNFIYSFFRTIQYTVLSVIFINLFAFGMALLVTRKLKLTNLYRAGFFMPNLIGGLVLGYIWKFVYSSALPAISEALGPNLSLNADTAMGALIAVVIWQYAGYIMMIYIAALQNVPQDLIEASKIDGANAWQRLKTITLPLVAQAFTISLFLTLVTSFKQFDTVISLTGGAPAALLPEWIQSWLNESTRSIKSMNLMAVDIYNTGWVESDFAIGQAKAVIFFLFLLIVSIVQVTYNKRKEVEL